MEATTGVWTPADFEQRLAALDRAINYSHDHDISPDAVVEIASQFEKYLTRSDA